MSDDDPGSGTHLPPGGDAPGPTRHEHSSRHGHSGRHERLDRWEEAAIAAEMATGHREETVEEAKKSLVKRLARLVAGGFLTILGVLMLVLPGPGILCMVAGLALIAPEVPFADRWMQRLRKRLPEGEDGELSKGFLAVSIGFAVVLVGVSSWISWMKFTNENWDIPLIPVF